MIKDFRTYDTDGVYELSFPLPGDDDIAAMSRDAQDFDSFVRLEVKEMGPISKVDGVWFTVTLMFTDPKDATWYQLKWA